jgi:coxsackievirus/adenovirus receptor
MIERLFYTLFICFMIEAFTGCGSSVSSTKDNLLDADLGLELPDVKEIDFLTPVDIENDILPSDTVEEEISSEEPDYISEEISPEEETAEVETTPEVNPEELIAEEVTETFEEEEYIPPITCNPADNKYPVCGTDGKTYANYNCAAYYLCKDSVTCPGCTGTKSCDTTKDPPDPIKYKGECSCKNDCTEDEKKLLTICGDCGGTPQSECYGTMKTFASKCEMKCSDECTQNACKDSKNPKCFEDYIVSQSACMLTCGDCPLDEEPVCSTGGCSYMNKCVLYNCPSKTGEKMKCGGKCEDVLECMEKKGCDENCQMVCGEDNKTYANECVADCRGVEIQYPQSCCPKSCCSKCTEDKPVCGTDMYTYKNQCMIDCLLVPKKYDGACTCDCTLEQDPKCGKDGNTYTNQCWLDCAKVDKLYDGACKTICPQCAKIFDPVCGYLPEKPETEITIQNQCFAECLKAAVSESGLCSLCEDFCGTPDAPTGGIDPVCGVKDGVTYPNSCFPFKCMGLEFNKGACTE